MKAIRLPQPYASSDAEIVSDQGVTTQQGREFPVDMPFSTTVPLVCRAVKHFIGDYYMFARGLPDMHASIRSALDYLLTEVVHQKLNSILDHSLSLNVSQAVQVTHFRNFASRLTAVLLLR